LPQDWQELGWVRLRAADFPALHAFYRDRIGLVPIREEEGCALFDLGDNTTLELLPGGESRPTPKLQMASQAAMILRVVSVASAVAKLKAQNVVFVHELFSPPRGDLAYIADPEGNVIGLADRLHPGAYAGQYSFYPEDLEAQRRWVEPAGINDRRFRVPPGPVTVPARSGG
jgi:predicted enzyme related to lactoylglutathione lyase